MTNAFQALQGWRDTKPGLLAFGVVEFGLMYLFLAWAIDSGSLLAWLGVFVFLIGGAQNIVKLAWRLLHSSLKRSA